MPLPYGARPCQAGTAVSKDVRMSAIAFGLMVGGRNRREQSR